MKMIAVILGSLALTGSVYATGVAPDTEMTSLASGFALALQAPLTVPTNLQNQSVFVLQNGKLYAGMWAWRGTQFIVLRDMADPSSDIALDSTQPSCQVHMDKVANPLSGAITFNPMLFSGHMNPSEGDFYTAESAFDGGATFMSCLTGGPVPAGTSRKFLARDFSQVWGAMVSEIQDVR